MAGCGGTDAGCGGPPACPSERRAIATRPPAAPPPGSLARFAQATAHAVAAVRAHQAAGRPVVGILCEFTPREVILAAGALPVCLCGGQQETIPLAEERLPANLCPLIKSTFGWHLRGDNPLLEACDLIVAEATCDGKKKMYEQLAETRALHLLDLPQRPERPGALPFWRGEIEGLITELRHRFRVPVDAAALRAAARTMNRERAARRALAATMQRPAPPLTGRQLLACRSAVSGLPDDLAAYEAGVAELAAAPGLPGADDRVRVLLTGVPMVSGAERVLEIIEDSGAIVVAQETCTGLKPLLEDVDAEAPDIVEAIARKHLHLPCAVMHGNDRRLESLRALARGYRAEAVIDLAWQACTTYEVESWRVRRLAEDELGLPSLRIGTDYGGADSARIQLRVEALVEAARERRS